MIDELFDASWAAAAIVIALIVGITFYNVQHDQAKQDTRRSIVTACATQPDPVACAQRLVAATEKTK